MYVGYFDDSYASDGAVITLAGYVATEQQWQFTERELASLFAAFGVDTLHTMEFHRRRGCFEGWKKDKRKAFVHGLGIATRNLTMALSVSVNRQNYKARQSELNINAGMSAYCVAFAAIVHKAARGNSLWKDIDKQGLVFVVEHGNQNNAEIGIHFDLMRNHEVYGDCLKALEFSAKDGSRAIQLADFFAFYSRRWADNSVTNSTKGQLVRDDELVTLNRYLTHHLSVANDPYQSRVGNPHEAVYDETRPPGPLPSEVPVVARPMRRTDKRRRNLP